MPPNNNYTQIPNSDDRSNSTASSFLNETSSSGLNTADNIQEPMDLPPAYEPSPNFEQFEIEEDEGNLNEEVSIRSKAGLLADSFNRRVVQPLSNAIDPVYQLYCYANAQFEYGVSKMGNPMIVKRILYIVFVSAILYIASLSGLSSESVVGGRSDFSDPEKLSEFISMSVDPKRIEENLEYISSMPHIAGTVGDLVLSKYLQDLILQSRLELNNDILFEAYTNYPLEPKVQLLKDDDVLIDCDLKENLEDFIENDIYKLAFNPGSKDKTVQGKVVYVNYGMEKDYDKLKSLNIDVNDSILIMKYGGVYPAHKKLQIAQDRGAAGVLFISDPSLSMYYNNESIQREPVAFSHRYPGNMLAPGMKSGQYLQNFDDFENDLKNAGVMAEIPSLPIKWKDFISIMKEVGKNGGTHISEWDFTLNNENVQIMTSSENLKINLQNKLTQKPNKEMWNVIGKLQGAEQDSFALVIGASRDSACYGAMESSGTAILIELINVFNEMSRSMKWQPLRTIYFVSYTGSKYNFAGSTNFAMKNSEFFRRDVYSFIDLDDIIQGDNLDISADPLFQSAILDTVGKLMAENDTNHEIKFTENNMNYKLTSLSSAYNMVEHFNIGSISMKLTKDNSNALVPQYPKNSCLDTFKRFQEQKIDPEMSKHVFMTKLVAEVALKLVDTPILPFDIRRMFDSVKDRINEVKAFTKSKNKSINFSQVDQLLNAMNSLWEQNNVFVKTWNDICDNGRGPEPNILSVNRWDWNAKLLLLNKVMINVDGTYKNPWNHNVFYGIETRPETRSTDVSESNIRFDLPGIWDAIDSNDWDNAVQSEINDIVLMLENCINLFNY